MPEGPLGGPRPAARCYPVASVDIDNLESDKLDDRDIAREINRRADISPDATPFTVEVIPDEELKPGAIRIHYKEPTMRGSDFIVFAEVINKRVEENITVRDFSFGCE